MTALTESWKAVIALVVVVGVLTVAVWSLQPPAGLPSTCMSSKLLHVNLIPCLNLFTRCFDNFGYDHSLNVTAGRLETVSETQRSNLTHQRCLRWKRVGCRRPFPVWFEQALCLAAWSTRIHVQSSCPDRTNRAENPPLWTVILPPRA